MFLEACFLKELSNSLHSLSAGTSASQTLRADTTEIYIPSFKIRLLSVCRSWVKYQLSTGLSAGREFYVAEYKNESTDLILFQSLGQSDTISGLQCMNDVVENAILQHIRGTSGSTRQNEPVMDTH